jgi:phage terminase large subunit
MVAQQEAEAALSSNVARSSEESGLMLSPAEPWPPDYLEHFLKRAHRIDAIKEDPRLRLGLVERYRRDPVAWINHWAVTYDPRNAGSNVPTLMPFVLFRKQEQLAQFLLDCLDAEANGLVEKSRDMGATWLCAAFSVWLWLYWPGASIGWGSRKEALVDKIGDPDSIMEKIRLIIRNLPRFMRPIGFNEVEHMPFMKIVNPQSGATITGEAGDNIGRGGRKLIYFKDESAHYERPEKIEASLSDTTNCQIDFSSVNGLNNAFHRKREAGQEWEPGVELARDRTNVFVMDWRDHPAKTSEWYELRRSKAESEGILHVFEQEVNRNYAAAVAGIIIPADWVSSAIDAHIKLGFDDSGGWGGALDPADEGGDLHALAMRKGPILKSIEDWGEGDTGQATRKAVGTIEEMRALPIEFQYDSIGVGAGVKAEANRLASEFKDDKKTPLLPKTLRFVPWSAGAGVLEPDERVIPDDPESPLNKDFYANLKAQGWWQLRLRFERTHKAVTKGESYDPATLISLPSSLAGLQKLRKELSQATRGKTGALKMLVNKTPEGTRSPNMADAVVMAFWPLPPSTRYTWDV